MELHIFEARSLKEKRMVVNSMLGRWRARFNVSAAQLDDHDLWQSATLAVAAVSNDVATLHTVLNQARDLAETETRCDITACRVEII